MDAYRPETIVVKKAGTFTVGAGKPEFVFPYSGRILSVCGAVGTAPTGAAATFDVNVGGTTIFTTQANRPKASASSTTIAATTPDVTTVAAGAVLTVDIDVIGSTVAGADAALVITYVTNS